ncbi:hypothetical protein OHA72_59390 [Dactylosporangium sp. NBC_01737]|uniref:hypothetical protein n=1 Tax=Dactylosporangium sp. NBC_01737 TaxID=2975959 RepID=UPI002E0E28F1|nr:hypothetical protein OHA72_59390 [Dactylosporangium sp. NBC_01737]
MIDNGRPSPFSGFWACLAGGAAIAALLLYLDPVVRSEDCPNYGGNGNASAFDDPGWDLGLMMLLIGWMAAVLVEQTLPRTWRHRSRAGAAGRAVAALLLVVASSCGLFLNVAVLCH